MTRLRHARALVRHAHMSAARTFAARAFGDRIPGLHRPVLRLTGVVTALAVATTGFTPVPAFAGTRGARLTSAHPSTPSAQTTPPRSDRAERPIPASTRYRGEPPASPSQTPRPALADPSTTPTDGAPFTPAQEPSSATSPFTRPPMSSDSEPAAPAQESLPDLPDLPLSLRLEQRFTESVLRDSGIRWRSTGGCSDRTVRTCTSFKGVRWGTVKGLIRFAESSGCKITVTGGTERGHAPGRYSHANGYKLDIAPGRCVDAAIKRYPSAGTRGDGARLYRAPDGTVFAREKDHWDITFR